MKYPKLVSPIVALTLAVLPTAPVFAQQVEEGVNANSGGTKVSAFEEAPIPEDGNEGDVGKDDGGAQTETDSGGVASGPEAADSGEAVSEPEVEGDSLTQTEMTSPDEADAQQDVAEMEAGEEEEEAISEPEGPQKPPEPMVGGKPATGKGMMIAGGSILAAGIAGLAASIVLTDCKEIASTIGCRNNPHRKFVIPISASVITLGGLLLTFGVVNHVKYRRWEKWTPGTSAVLAPSIFKNGGGLSYAARF